jgi:DNA-binding protein WhiA
LSFGEEVRDELAHRELSVAPALPLLAGAFRSAGSLHLTGRGRIHGELDVAGHAVARALIQALKGHGAECEIRRYTTTRLEPRTRFRIIVEGDPPGLEILRAIGLIDHRDHPRTPPARIAFPVSDDRRAYLRGAFMAAGTVSAPERPALLEFRCPDRSGADEIARLAGSAGYTLRIREHGGRWEASTRRRETVAGLLLLLGAEEAALRCEEAEVLLLTREGANRRANFDTANLRRQVAATQAQLTAIALLRAAGRLSELSEPLRETANLREEEPDLPLGELAVHGGVSRPTLAARLRRLCVLAEEEALSRRRSL